MLQFQKAAFSLETAVKNSRTGVGRRFFGGGGRSWSGSQKLLAPFHPAVPSLGSSEPVSVWAQRFPQLGRPENDQICCFFTALFAHQPTNCHWTADTAIHSGFTLCGSNNPQTSDTPRISSRANVLQVECPAGSQASWCPTQKFNILFFSWWHALLNLLFIHRNIQPCSRPKHPIAWPKSSFPTLVLKHSRVSHGNMDTRATP